MKVLALLLLVAATAHAARDLQAATYPILDDYEPLYSVLNITGWDDYPEGCWLFPLPAINVVIDGKVYLLSARSQAGAPEVAAAWCDYNGFDGVGEWRLQDWSESQSASTVDIATGAVASGVSGPGGAGMQNVVAFKYLECTKSGATAGCSRRYKAGSNNGVDNMGYGNGVGSVPAATNVGNFNDGSTNLGDWNTGSANFGSFNVGSANKGNCIRGASAVTGSFVPCPPYTNS